MERNITNEIIIALLEEEKHVRGLAQALGTNHVTMLNKLDHLVAENVLDFRKKGRNKVYFLKRSAEVTNYIYIAEIYKVNETIKKYPALRGIIDAVRSNTKIECAVLFGSYAKGTADKTSDIDIFLETRSRHIKQELEQLHSMLSVKIGNIGTGGPLVSEIKKHHVIIKGVELYYEKTKAFH